MCIGGLAEYTAACVWRLGSSLLVLLCAPGQGRKSLVAIEKGLRESESGWSGFVTEPRAGSLAVSPKRAVGDGALVFWKAVARRCSGAAHQQFCVHKAADVLFGLPESVPSKTEDAQSAIKTAGMRDKACMASDRTLVCFEANSPAPGRWERPLFTGDALGHDL